ncbi:MAG: hypothetical protein JWP27_1128 [Flaviaesturariibacter sp.]|nr:hypothetical protein [Flaviaesturariibacter sp.]
MKPRNVFFTLFLALMILFIFIRRVGQEPRSREPFERHPHSLVYTRHARCRMDCRQISEDDIADILDHGVINLNQSNRNDRPCPTFAVQGQTDDGESLRVIFAQCDAQTKVVTCYNLKKHVSCYCPGDEKGGLR